MDSKTRATLRALASREDTIAQIGKDGPGENLTAALDAALTARELIKIGVLKSSARGAMELADELAAATRSEVVTVIGAKIVLYRRSGRAGVRHVLGEEERRDPKRKPNASQKTNYKGEHFAADERRGTVMKRLAERKRDHRGR